MTYKPYCYLLKCPDGRVYYGSSYTKKLVANPKKFWTEYFTTSKDIHAMIEEYGKESFEFEIRKTFDCHEKCHQWETKVLHRMNVIHDDRFVNKSNNVNFGANIGGHNWTDESKKKSSEARLGEANPMYGKSHSEENKKKWSEMKKGKPKSAETKRKMSEAQKLRHKRNKENAIH